MIRLIIAVFLLLGAAEGADEKSWPVTEGDGELTWPNTIGEGLGETTWPFVTSINFTLDANAEGCWFMSTTSVQADAEADHCLVNQTNNAAQVGNPVYTSTDVPAGSPDGAHSVIFDGTLDRFDVSDTGNFFDSSKVTAGCWINRDVGAGTGVVFRKGATLNSINFHINTGAAGSVRMHQNALQVVSGTAASENVWEHWVLRYDSIEIQSYRNGLQDCPSDICTAQTSDRANDAGALGLGDTGGASNFEWTGKMYECFYFKAALTLPQVCEIAMCGMEGNANGVSRVGAFGASGCTCDEVTCC